jgi:hypothetical protein
VLAIVLPKIAAMFRLLVLLAEPIGAAPDVAPFAKLLARAKKLRLLSGLIKASLSTENCCSPTG